MEKLAIIGINGPVFTEGLVQHTSMCNSLIRSILEVHLPHSPHRSATVNTPANRLHAHSLSR